MLKLINKGRSIIIKGNRTNGANRLNSVQEATSLKKKNQKWEHMKCTVTVKTVAGVMHEADHAYSIQSTW